MPGQTTAGEEKDQILFGMRRATCKSCGMQNRLSANRRAFLRSSLFGSALLGAYSFAPRARAALTRPDRDPCDGLKLGLTSYTLRNSTLDQVLATTKDAGVKYISLKD